MQNATQSNYVPRHSQRVVVFPGSTPARLQASETHLRFAHARFERLLIFVLFTLWAVGMAAWTLFSIAGFGYGVSPGSLALHPVSMPTSLPTLQSATVFAIRLVVGW
jgi:hypothetical protein